MKIHSIDSIKQHIVLFKLFQSIFHASFRRLPSALVAQFALISEGQISGFGQHHALNGELLGSVPFTLCNIHFMFFFLSAVNMTV